MCPENNYTHTHTHTRNCIIKIILKQTVVAASLLSACIFFIYILSLYLRTGCAARHRAATIYVLVPFHFNFIIFDHAFAAALASFIEIFSSWCGFFLLFLCVLLFVSGPSHKVHDDHNVRCVRAHVAGPADSIIGKLDYTISKYWIIYANENYVS